MAFGNVIFQILFSEQGILAVDKDSVQEGAHATMDNSLAEGGDGSSLNVQSLSNDEGTLNSKTINMKIVFCIG